MPNNDNTVLAVPVIQCPSCMRALDVSRDKIFSKLSRAQRKAVHNGTDCESTTRSWNFIDNEMAADDDREHLFVVVSCDNSLCKQYNVFKVLKLPKIVTPGMRISLE